MPRHPKEKSNQSGTLREGQQGVVSTSPTSTNSSTRNSARSPASISSPNPSPNATAPLPRQLSTTAPGRQLQSNNPPSAPRTPTPTRATPVPASSQRNNSRPTGASRATATRGAAAGSSPERSGTSRADQATPDRRRHTFSKLPAPSRTSPTPSPSQSPSPPLPAQQRHSRHVFGNTTNLPQRAIAEVTASGPTSPSRGPGIGGLSSGSIHSPMGPSSAASSSTNVTPANGSRRKADFTSFNPIARPEPYLRHGTPTATSRSTHSPYSKLHTTQAPELEDPPKEELCGADLGLDTPPGTPPESPPMSALTGGSPHSRPADTQYLPPVDGAMVEPEDDPCNNKPQEGTGSGTTMTNVAYFHPPCAPASNAGMRQNGEFESRSVSIFPGFGSREAAAGAGENNAVETAGEVKPLARGAATGVLKHGVADDSGASLNAESAAFTTNPLFSNPLFTEAGGLDGCFSKLPDDACGDAILAIILGYLLDEDYPNSVWSGCFTPGKANQLRARSTSSLPGHPPAALSHFPMDGRPNNGTRALLDASTVCSRWRRVVGSNVIKHAAYFSYSQPPPRPLVLPHLRPKDPSGFSPVAATTQRLFEGQSLTISSELTGECDHNQDASESYRHVSSPDTAVRGTVGAFREHDVVRWPVWFAAETVVCVLQEGAMPFDLGRKEAVNLQSLCVLKDPETPPPSTSDTLHEYDARCVARLASLSSLTLPIPSPKPLSWDLLRTLPKIQTLDISSPIGAPPVSQPKVVRPSAAVSHSDPSRECARLPSALHGCVKALVATLPTFVAASSSLTQLTALRLCGPLESDQKGLVSHLSVLTDLQSLAISSPVAWATKAPGALQQHQTVDTMRFTSGSLTVLQCMSSLQTLSLAGCACIDNDALSLVALVTTLTSLDVSVCRRLTDDGVTQLRALSMLRDLDVSWCDRLGSRSANFISLLSQLESLDMSGCMHVDDVGALQVCNMKQLTSLSLKGCTKVSTGGLQRIVSLTALKSISVSSETDQGFGLASWGQFGGLVHLTHMCLRGFKALEKDGLQCMARMHGLREVVVDCCPGIDGAEIKYLSGLQQLKKVVLRFCPKIDDQALMHLKHATALEELSLQGSTAFYGNGLCHLSPLTRLHTLDLQQCTRVDVTGLAYLAGLPRLLTVNVAKCPRIQGADFVHLSTLQEHPHLVVVGLEGSSLDVARECGFRVAPSPAAFM